MADPLSISASIVTVLQLAKDVIGYLNDARNAPKDRQRLRDEISSTAYYLYMLKDAAERAARSDEIPPSITSLFGDQGPLKQFQSALEQLTAKLIPVGRFKGPACCLIWPFERSHIDQILASIERQKGLFTLALQTEDLYVQCQVCSLNAYLEASIMKSLISVTILLQHSFTCYTYSRLTAE